MLRSNHIWDRDESVLGLISHTVIIIIGELGKHPQGRERGRGSLCVRLCLGPLDGCVTRGVCKRNVSGLVNEGMDAKVQNWTECSMNLVRLDTPIGLFWTIMAGWTEHTDSCPMAGVGAGPKEQAGSSAAGQGRR